LTLAAGNVGAQASGVFQKPEGQGFAKTRDQKGFLVGMNFFTNRL
jgi:hypothetical protein